MTKPDSLIFDMDGTLWDGLDIYVECWNKSFNQFKVKKNTSREELSAMVGWENKKVLETLLPEHDWETRHKIHQVVSDSFALLLGEINGRLYEGVKEGLAKLSEKYQLFIVSNCGENVIQLFMKWAGITKYITDEMAHGANKMPKHHNMKLIIDKYQLKNAVYIGDTEHDQEQSRLAGLPFIFVSYGFGSAAAFDLRFDHFQTLSAHFINLKS